MWGGSQILEVHSLQGLNSGHQTEVTSASTHQAIFLAIH